MNYRQRRAQACREAFEGFEIQLGMCHKPEVILQVLELAKEGLFSDEIAERIGRSPKAVQKIFRRYNFPILHNIEPPRREERIGWAGGRKIVGGHAYLRCPGHPRASKHGNYVAEHRLVVEAHLGRFLEPGEVVHHIDNDPLNNNIENLKIFASNGEHLRETLTGKPHNVSPEGRAAIRKQVTERHARNRALKAASNQKG